MKTTVTVLLAGMVFGLSSCSNYNTRAKNNAASGALIGGAAGALMGDDKVESAAAGAAIGGAAGYALGR
ncbi:MAG: hypothetical protein Q7Q71_12060 [Verrucomicrobiota bacterium JB023]|nr:hypothetical protein [Verrucomicrobiota bacterium JB023]